jgi:hypothetical protein
MYKSEDRKYRPGAVDAPTDFPKNIVPSPSQTHVDTVKIDLTGLLANLNDSKKHEPSPAQQRINLQQDLEKKNYALKIRDATHRIRSSAGPETGLTPGNLDDQFS